MSLLPFKEGEILRKNNAISDSMEMQEQEMWKLFSVRTSAFNEYEQT